MELLSGWGTIVESLLPGFRLLLGLFVVAKVLLYALRWLRWAS